MGNIVNTPLECFEERQFYFTTIPVPCDYDTILTSFYGKNWGHVDNRVKIGKEKGGDHKPEAHAVSDEENEKYLLGGPRPMCAS